MKKTAAILLICILVFNIIGYRWAFTYLEQKATQRLESKIDAGQYSEYQLLEIKIPLNAPYYNDTEYEDCYGETEFNGEHYRYVKRKIANNILYLLCLPNKEKNNIIAAKTHFFKAINDISDQGMPQQQGPPSYIKLMLSEFMQESTMPDLSSRMQEFKKAYFFNTILTSQFEPHTVAQPPELT